MKNLSWKCFKKIKIRKKTKNKITLGEDNVISFLLLSSFTEFFDESSSLVGSCSVVISSLVFEESIVSVFFVEKKLSANESLISNEKS